MLDFLLLYADFCHKQNSEWKFIIFNVQYMFFKGFAAKNTYFRDTRLSKIQKLCLWIFIYIKCINIQLTFLKKSNYRHRVNKNGKIRFEYRMDIFESKAVFLKCLVSKIKNCGTLIEPQFLWLGRENRIVYFVGISKKVC